MKRILLILLLFTGCCTRPWKTLHKPVMVHWQGGEGDLWLAHDKSFALLYTNTELKMGEKFLYDHKLFCVVDDCGVKYFKFMYVLESKPILPQPEQYREGQHERQNAARRARDSL